jgi:hypothetical protein
MFGSTSVNGDIDMESEVNAQGTSYRFALKRVEENVLESQDPKKVKEEQLVAGRRLRS